MAKAASGQANIVLQAGRSKFQRDADQVLTDADFSFVRRTGHSSNLYHHDDGRKIIVHATPRNPSNAMGYIKQKLRNPETAKQRQGIEDPMATTEASVATRMVALADPFLFNQEDNSRHATRARASALASWVKRAVERYGPVLAGDLSEACASMGYSASSLAKARVAAGVVGYVVPGSAKGKGQLSAWVCLSHQVPEGASVTGRRTRAELTASQNGVEPVEPDPVLRDVAFIDGPDTIDESAGGDPSHPLNRPPEHSGVSLADARELKRFAREADAVDAAFREPAGSVGLPDGGAEVSAAAQMLLETLGLKTMDPVALEQLIYAQAQLGHAGRYIDAARSALNSAVARLA